jgi:hypothetical protein
MIWLEKTTTTSDNTGTLLSQHILLDAIIVSDVVVFLSPIAILTLNGKLWIVPLVHSVNEL